jgi:pantoate--beta-alanine ligase
MTVAAQQMLIVHDIAQMQRLGIEGFTRGLRSALVPTMGALHEGHLALAREARNRADRVVVSIFVNPAQFGPNEDFHKYPRPFEADCELAEREGVDILFNPSFEDMYPEGYQTYVTVEEVSRPLCGLHRPVHFRGVATVVLKLFNIVQPQAAVFGWKDAQQFILLRRMVGDLNLPVEMIGVETIRERDGLAMSSRNKYLSAEERAVAPLIYQGLCALREAATLGERGARKLLEVARAKIALSPLFNIQYLEMVSVSGLEPLPQLEPGNTLVAVAAKLGATRLIDNVQL